MGNGSFQERLIAALQLGDEVTIRHEVNALDDYEYYLIIVQMDNERFGTLRQSEEVLVTKATPHNIVGAIERAAARIMSAVDMMTDAQVEEPDEDNEEET